jgi:myo-inositol-1-phosphate synthase
MTAVRIAIVGVGNCASSLVQGLHFYRDADPSEEVPGLMHVRLGPYHVSDVEVVAAFDVDGKKVGKDVSEAIFTEPNNTIRFVENVPPTGVQVLRGPTLDGLGRYYRDMIQESDEDPVDVAGVLRDAGVDVVINYLPVGSEHATRHYARAALRAGAGVVNCIPVFIASDRTWAREFAEAGVPLVGDDIKSQVGATILHRVLAKLFQDRGVHLDHTSQLPNGIEPDDIHIGPSDHVPWLKDRKWAHIRLEGREFGDVPMSVELKLEVWDSPNSAGVAIDAIRGAKLALDRGVAGPLIGPSAYFMKSPPVQFSDDAAREMVEEFILGNGASKDADWSAFFDTQPQQR